MFLLMDITLGQPSTSLKSKSGGVHRFPLKNKLLIITFQTKLPQPINKSPYSHCLKSKCYTDEQLKQFHDFVMFKEN